MTNAELIAPARLKLDRSWRHFEELRDAIFEFQRDGCELTRELSDVPGLKDVRFRLKRQIPPEWGCMIGDAIHNLRSALDVLAVGLAQINGKTSTRNMKDTYFPVSSSQEEYEMGSIADAVTGRRTSRGLDKIRHLSQDDSDRISTLRPYKDGNDLLWKLHQIDILDKHQIILTTFTSLLENNWQMAIAPVGGSNWVRLGAVEPQLLKDGDRLLSYPVSQPDESVNVEAAIHVVFQGTEFVDGEQVLHTIHEMGLMVHRVVADFEAVYGASGP